MGRWGKKDRFFVPPVETVNNLIGLPKTGQTTSYNTGDDGDYEAGSAISPRFTDNGDGTITDNVTGLMWVKDGYCNGSPPSCMQTYVNALAYAEALNYAEHTDWRLPNVFELMSIVDVSKSPAVPTIFTNTAAYFYRTSTECGSTKLCINFGLPIVVSAANPTEPFFLRCVRGGTINGS